MRAPNAERARAHSWQVLDPCAIYPPNRHQPQRPPRFVCARAIDHAHIFGSVRLIGNSMTVVVVSAVLPRCVAEKSRQPSTGPTATTATTRCEKMMFAGVNVRADDTYVAAVRFRAIVLVDQPRISRHRRSRIAATGRGKSWQIVANPVAPSHPRRANERRGFLFRFPELPECVCSRSSATADRVHRYARNSADEISNR